MAVDRSIPDDRMEKYLEITKNSLATVEILHKRDTEGYKTAKEFLTMARAYYNDAIHFMKQGDIVNAYGCINYSQGWIDSGIRAGLFRKAR